MNITMNLPALILTTLLVLSVCVLLLCIAFHQFAKGINQAEEAKTWNATKSDDGRRDEP